MKATLSNEEILKLRESGATLKEIALRAGICSARVGQIIRQDAPDLNYVRIRRDPKEFIGAKLDGELKSALKAYTKERGISISAFIGDAVKEKLTTLGVEIVRRVPIDRGEPLPFDDVEET